MLPAESTVGSAGVDLFGRHVGAAGVLYVVVDIGRSPSVGDPNRARRDGNLDRAQPYLDTSRDQFSGSSSDSS